MGTSKIVGNATTSRGPAVENTREFNHLARFRSMGDLPAPVPAATPGPNRSGEGELPRPGPHQARPRVAGDWNQAPVPGPAFHAEETQAPPKLGWASIQAARCLHRLKNPSGIGTQGGGFLRWCSFTDQARDGVRINALIFKPPAQTQALLLPGRGDECHPEANHLRVGEVPPKELVRSSRGAEGMLPPLSVYLAGMSTIHSGGSQWVDCSTRGQRLNGLVRFPQREAEDRSNVLRHGKVSNRNERDSWPWELLGKWVFLGGSRKSFRTPRMVRTAGLEPARLTALPPQSSASANSATCATTVPRRDPR